MKHPAPEFPELAHRLEWRDVDEGHRTWTARAVEGASFRVTFQGPDATGRTYWHLVGWDLDGDPWSSRRRYPTLASAQRGAEAIRWSDLRKRAEARSSGLYEG